MKYILTSKPSILAFLARAVSWSQLEVQVSVVRVGVQNVLFGPTTYQIAMTRVTNFGLKRTYLEAGFSNDETPSKEADLIVPGGEQSSTDPTPAAPPKKKRKRTPKSKRDGNLTKNAAEGKGEAGKNDTENVTVEIGATVPATGKSAKKNKRNKERRKSKSLRKTQTS